MRSAAAIVLFVATGLSAGTAAQGPPLTLPQAVAQAIERYPSVRAAASQAAAATAGAALAHDAYLPRADLLWQINRSTRNNTAGLLFPQPVISPISGPVSAESNDAIWNHALGVLVAWEPFDFGYRAGQVHAAEGAQRAAAADQALTTLQVAAAAADAYVTVLAADEGVRAATAGVDRARTIEQIVSARASAGLRPGAEAARAQAEVAAAESAEARAQQTAAIARAELSRWIGVPPEQIRVSPLPAAPMPADAVAPEPALHPRLLAASGRLDAARAAETAAAKAYVPRLFLDATTYARGSGATATGAIGEVNGFSLTAKNWAVGFNVTFPLLDGPALRDRHAIEMARAQDAAARYDQAVRDLSADVARAAAILAAARRIAALAPAQLDAARAAEEQARARYNSGLGTIGDVADTQRLLTEAEIASSLAALSVWRAQFGLAAARGDLSPVLAATGGSD